MYAAMDTMEVNLFFQLVNDFTTSDRSLKEWTELLGDVGVASSILDHLIHRCTHE